MLDLDQIRAIMTINHITDLDPPDYVNIIIAAVNAGTLGLKILIRTVKRSYDQIDPADQDRAYIKLNSQSMADHFDMIIDATESPLRCYSYASPSYD